VFILLALMFSVNSSFEVIRELGLFIYLVGGFFSISCFFALLAELTTDEIKKKRHCVNSKRVMIVGFAVLMTGFIITGLYFMNPR